MRPGRGDRHDDPHHRQGRAAARAPRRRQALRDGCALTLRRTPGRAGPYRAGAEIVISCSKGRLSPDRSTETHLTAAKD
jgi:hypothetical protein